MRSVLPQPTRPSPPTAALCRRRPGALLSTELLFVLPLAMLLLLAFVEFSFLISAETKVTLASREGARAAALGGSPSDVLDAITRVLNADVVAKSTWDITFPNVATTTGNPVEVSLAVPANALVPILVFGGFDPAALQLKAKTTMIIE